MRPQIRAAPDQSRPHRPKKHRKSRQFADSSMMLDGTPAAARFSPSKALETVLER